MLAKLVIITLASSCLVHSLPQYGSGQLNSNNNGRVPSKRPQLGPGCQIKYKSVHSVEYKEEYETKCEVKYRKDCQEKFERLCEPYREKKCKTEYKQVCQVLYRDNCYEAYKDAQEEYTEDVCVDKYRKVCEKHWVTQSDNEKIWADDPATCKDLKETECNPVQKYRTVKQPYRKCDKVPYDECKNEPYEACNWVESEKCRNQPYQDCRDVPYDDCQEVHKNVPHQVTKVVPLRVCDGKEPYEYTREEVVDYDLLDPRNGFDEDLLEEEPEKLTGSADSEEKKKPSSAIIFG